MNKKPSRLTRYLALLWLIVSLTSGIASMYFLIKAWNIKPMVVSTAVETLNSGINLIKSVEEGTLIVDNALENIGVSIKDLEGSTTLIKNTVHDTASMSASFNILLSEDFTVMTENTLVAIQSTEKSAAVIDGTLLALSRVPLLGVPYDPETSLSTALGNIAEEMEDMPEILNEISVSMESTSDNLYALETQIEDVSTSLDSMQETLDQAVILVGDYQQYAQDAQENLGLLIEKLDSFVKTLLWVLTVFVVVIMNGLIAAIVQSWKIVFQQRPE